MQKCSSCFVFVFNRRFSTAEKSADDLADVQLLVYTVYTVYTQKIVQCTQCTQQCTLCVHTCQMFTTSGRVQLYTVRQFRMHECTMHGGIRHPDLDLES